MAETHHGRIAIVYPGDAEIRRSATPQNNRFAPLFQAFAEAGVAAEPAVYHDRANATSSEQRINSVVHDFDR